MNDICKIVHVVIFCSNGFVASLSRDVVGLQVGRGEFRLCCFFHRKVEFRLSIAVPDGPIDHVGFGVAFVLFFMNAIILQNKTLF